MESVFPERVKLLYSKKEIILYRGCGDFTVQRKGEKTSCENQQRDKKENEFFPQAVIPEEKPKREKDENMLDCNGNS